MNYYKENKRRSQLASRTRILLRFYNEMNGTELDDWEEVPPDSMRLLFELGFEPVAKVYAKRLISEGKPLSEVSIATGLSIMKVQGLKNS